MRHSSSQSATLIIVLGIITMVLQLTSYYLLDSVLLIVGTTILLNLLCSHILLEKSLNFESCFSYSLFNIFLSIIIILVSFLANTSVFAFEQLLLLFVAFNWLVPTLYCMLRSLFNKSDKYDNFNTFFRNQSIVFLLIYAAVLVYVLFLHNAEYIIYATDMDSINVIPFLTLAILIEDFIVGSASLTDIFHYVINSFILFLPFGFYTMLTMRRKSRFARLSVILLFPLSIEAIQLLLSLGKGDIDDILFGIIGSLMGALGYFILNEIFLTFTDEEFLYKRPSYSFYKNTLHY
ncbi:MAG: putative rane protein [Anaerocolumna sp.]|nr:putative rane protein [Anaerocolumna sp.]